MKLYRTQGFYYTS